MVLLCLVFLIGCGPMPYAKTEILTIKYGSGGSAGGLGGTNLATAHFSDLNTSWTTDMEGKGIKVFFDSGGYFLYRKDSIVAYGLKTCETDLMHVPSGQSRIGLNVKNSYDIDLDKLKAEGRVYYK